MGRQQFLVVVLMMASLFLFFGCEDGKLPFSVEIVEVSTTMDTVTITFSEDITEVDMPNSISFASSTFTFTVTDAGGTAVELGLLDSTTDSVTLAVLGRTGITGTYQFTLILGDETDSVLEKSEDVEFTTWTGSIRYLELFGDLYVQVKTNTEAAYYDDTVDPIDTNLVSGLSASSFTLFDHNGNKKNCTFVSADSGLAKQIVCSPGLVNGYYWLRFNNAGNQPRYAYFYYPLP